MTDVNFSSTTLRNDELATYRLREIYQSFGYSPYKVSKFEEYDLYAHNKNFLLSENILTFTDTNGKLMALKPDITLSIIKNVSDDTEKVQKLYYNETVYRTSAESHGFKEIMQTGLECIGNVDEYATSEVVSLAMKSLSVIGNDYRLDVSHMGLLEGLLREAGINDAESQKVSAFLKNKNTFELSTLCQRLGASEDIAKIICDLTEMYCPLGEALEYLRGIACNKTLSDATVSLEQLYDSLTVLGVDLSKLCFDFSVVNDFNYYDGIIFNGFINGIPESVLSGGRYDKLLVKMGKSSSAIGFAVYLDKLERVAEGGDGFDVDVFLLYDSKAPAIDVIRAVSEIRAAGESVRTSPSLDASCRYRRLVVLDGKEGDTNEAND